MITSFRHSEDIDKHIIKTPLDHTASWINVVEPDREEIENLMEQYNIPEDFIRDPLDSEESSRIEYDEDTGYSLIIIDLPIVNSTNRSVLSFVTIPLGIIIGNGIIVTVCDAENEFLENLPKRGINLTTIADHYNRNLRLLNKSRIRIEKELKNNITNKQLFKLMEVEKSLVYFLAALKGNDTIIKKLFRLPAIKRFEEDEELLEDLIIENNQAIETTELHQRILESITTSYASLLSNDMNTIMKTLTLFTVLLTLPTLVFSFFGMNVPLPIDDHSYISWIIVVGISLILVVIVSIFLWRKQKL